MAEEILFEVRIGDTDYSIDSDMTPQEFFDTLQSATDMSYLQLISHFRKSLGWKNKAMKPKAQTAFEFAKSLATDENGKIADLRLVLKSETGKKTAENTEESEEEEEEEDENDETLDEMYKTCFDFTLLNKTLNQSANSEKAEKKSKSSKGKKSKNVKFTESKSLPDTAFMMAKMMHQTTKLMSELQTQRNKEKEENLSAYNNVSTLNSNDLKLHQWISLYPTSTCQAFDTIPKIGAIHSGALRELNLNFVVQKLESSLDKQSHSHLRETVREIIPRLHSLAITAGLGQNRVDHLKSVIGYVDTFEYNQRNSKIKSYLTKGEIENHLTRKSLYWSSTSSAGNTQRYRRAYSSENKHSNSNDVANAKICNDYNSEAGCRYGNAEKCDKGIHCCITHFERYNTTRTRHPKTSCKL